MMALLLYAPNGFGKVTEQKWHVHSSKSDKVVKMPSRTWMYKVMDWIGKKDIVSLAGLDNTDVAGKQAMISTAELAKTVMDALGDDMPAELRQKVFDICAKKWKSARQC